MRDLQALAGEGSPPLRRRRGLGLVYLLAAVFPLFNALLLLGLFPSLAGVSSQPVWVLLLGFGLAWLLVEGLKGRLLRNKTPLGLIRAAFLDGLLLFVGLLLGVLAYKLGLSGAWLFVLLGLGSHWLGFARLAARLP